MPETRTSMTPVVAEASSGALGAGAAPAEVARSGGRGVFLDALSVLVLPACVLAMVDALGTTATLGIGSGPLLLIYVLPLFLSTSVVLAGGWAGLLRLRAIAAGRGLISLEGDARFAAWGATVAVAALGSGLVFGLAYATSKAFENRGLAAMLVAFVTLLSAVPLYAVWLAAFVGIRSVSARFASRPPLIRLGLWCAPLLPLLLVAAWLLRKQAGALSAVKPWLWLGPLAALLCFGVALLLWRRLGARLRRPLRLVLLVLLPLSAVGARVAGSVSADLPQLAVRAGFWSAKLVIAARVVTDVDRDGSSSLFGDDDCAPFNSAIHPLAHDIPGDGIDSNCFGGDATGEPGQQPPRWFDDAPGRAPGLNLVVVTIEAVRADHVPFHGYARQTMPNISELARRSQVFERAYSGANATVMSVLGLWGACAPTRVKGGRAGGAPVWIPELLQQEGFRTSAALVAYKRFDAFNRGFDRFDMATPLPMDGGMRGFQDGKLIDDTIEFIDKNRAGRFMAWAHLVGPHAVYERAPGAPNFGETQRDLYDSELWAADREVGRLVAHLRKRGLLERTVLIVAGDHGEALGEHGVETHHETLFDVELHTLSLMYLPGVEHHVLPQPVLHRDIVTTAMNVLGVERGFSELRGRNLAPLFSGQPLDNDVLFLEMVSYRGDPQKIAALRFPHKLHYDVKSRRKQFYDLREDPKEQREVGAAHRAEVDELSRRIAKHLEGRR